MKDREVRPGPNNMDRLPANISGLPQYLIDASGIWEIRPRALSFRPRASRRL